MKYYTLLIFIILIYPLTIFSQNISYQYDNLNRLTNVDYGNGTIISYTYDDVGNRIGLIIQSSELPPGSPTNISIETNSGNVVLSWDEVTSANSYKIFASDDPYGQFVDISSSGTFGTTTSDTSVTKLNSSRKQNTKTKKNISDETRNRQTWTSNITGTDKKFYYVTASTEERDNIPTSTENKSFKNHKREK